MIYEIKDNNGNIIYKSENQKERDDIYKQMIVEGKSVIKENKKLILG